MSEIGIAAPESFNAKGLICFFKLKKDFSSKKLELFRNESIELVISRDGISGGAAAAAFLINRGDNQKRIHFIHIGECRAANEGLRPGTLVLCHKITDSVTERSYYPDILFHHGLREASLITVPSREKAMPETPEGFDCADAQAAGFMEAAFTFLPPHRISCLKITGAGNTKPLLNKSHCAALRDFFSLVRDNGPGEESILTDGDREFLQRLCGALRFTDAMKNKLIKTSETFKKKDGNLRKVLAPYLSCRVSHKTESRKFFEKITGEMDNGPV